MPRGADRLRQYQLGVRGTVKATPILMEDPHDRRVRIGLNGKVLTKAFVPREGIQEVLYRLSHSAFVVEMKGCLIVRTDIVELFLEDEHHLFHTLNHPLEASDSTDLSYGIGTTVQNIPDAWLHT